LNGLSSGSLAEAVASIPGTGDAGALAHVAALHEAGLSFSAWARGRELFGPLPSWRGTEARLLAGRLLEATGAPRAARRAFLTAYRADRTDPAAVYFAAWTILERRGPLPFLRFDDRAEVHETATAMHRAYRSALRARAFAQLRDFDGAERELSAAERASVDDAWVQVERATVLAAEDRYPDAAAAARRALSLRPWYWPGVQCLAHVLQLTGGDGEALELLRAAASRCELAPLVIQLAALETAMGEHAAARRSCSRIVDLLPEMELETFRWVNARLSDAAYECGDLDEAIERAEISQSPFHLRVADRLKKSREGARVLLPVKFVRQHHLTCAPATLAAISAHWAVPAEQLEIAEAICYDGTPSHSERRWAEERSFEVREFRVTFASAMALVDRGVPSTLTIFFPGRGHLQALIGYDARRGTLLVRDPTVRNHVEIDAEGMLRDQAAYGPRGMALVPPGERARLDGVVLEDAELHDVLHRLDRALVAHDRPAATAALRALEDAAPGHRLALQGRRALAGYDGNALELLACADALLARYPENTNLLLSKIDALQRLGRRKEALELLERSAGHREPLLGCALAEELLRDAQRHERAEMVLQRAIRMNRTLGRAVFALAELRWNQLRRGEAVELFRAAACLDERDENRAHAYFVACNHLGRTAEALLFLRERFRRFGSLAGWPARTLFAALASVERKHEAFAALDEALDLRPDDGELRLFAAEAHARVGRFDAARAQLAAAKGKTKRTSWLRQEAEIEGYAGAPGSAMDSWRSVLEEEPLAIDAHTAIANLLAATEGPGAAVAHLDAAGERFPYHQELQRLRLASLRQQDPQRAVELAGRICEHHPEDAWTRKERALLLQRLGRTAEAFAELDAATRIDPRAESTWNVRGTLLEETGRLDEARSAFRASLRVTVDQPWAIEALLRSCSGASQRTAELGFVWEEIRRQALVGEGILAYRHAADGVLDPAALLAQLREAFEARPDLWQAWIALLRQLVRMRRLSEAVELAQRLAERFPLVPGTWREVAQVRAENGETDKEKKALETALALNPRWTDVVRLLAAAHERTGELAKVQEVLERAIAASPLDAGLHGALAETLERLGDRNGAIARLERSLRLEAQHGARWLRLVGWSADRALKLAREIVAQRPHDANSWMALAQALPDSALDDRLQALARAGEASPRSIPVHDLRAELLARAGRTDEALAACRPAVFGDAVPVPLRGRAICIAAQKGELTEAIRSMEALVETERDYRWGLCCLVEWYEKSGDAERALSVAERLVQVDPGSGFGRRAIAQLVMRTDPARARRELALAYRHDSGDHGAGMLLFDLHLENGDLDSAAATLAQLQSRLGGPFVAARVVALAARRGDLAEATKQLSWICAEPGQTSDWPIRSALAVMARDGWAPNGFAVIDSSMQAGKAAPEVAGIWVEQARQHLNVVSLWRRMTKLPAPLRAAAHHGYLLGSAKGSLLTFLLFLAFFKKTLCEDDVTWGTVGYALYARGLTRRAARWLREYERRSCEPWMLVNLINALILLGRDAEVDRVIDAARRLPGGDREVKVLAWAGYRSALRGEAESARQHLRSFAPSDPFSRFVCSVASTLTVDRFDEARAQLEEVARAVPPGTLAIKVYRGAVREIARRFGASRWWRIAQWFRV